MICLASRPRALVAVFVCAACAPPHTTAPARLATAGLAIALYGLGDPATAYGVVDDRRWVELDGHDLVLDHIDPGASLASLVIEPLGGGAPFAIERCAREALPEPPPLVTAPVKPSLVAAPPPPTTSTRLAPMVRCTVAGAPGRRLVRILYVSHTLTYRAQHDLVMTAPDRVQLATRFTIQTPAWRERADVVVFDGVPGGERTPTELARGPIALDGSIAILAAPTRDAPARLRWVYDGAITTPDADGADISWNAGSLHTVWVWLEVPHLLLAPGPIHARVELPGEAARELDLAGGPIDHERKDVDKATAKTLARDPMLLELPLWADAELTGSRSRFSDGGDDGELAERLLLSVSNQGDVPREVWVEERVRPSRHRKIERAWPKRPMASGDVVRAKLEIKPHTIERVGYTITYEF